ncbi:MAG: hypothetical protein K2I92_04640 [Muribaculaceae bacterium]|nr:hypothetical protein [Muribaculaceae bacterium]
MDDVCEHKFFSFNMNWSPYTYVSCWTENSEESIPLWHMYSKGGVGVRIAIDKDCIVWDEQIFKGQMLIPGQEVYPPERKGHGMISISYHPFAIYDPLSTKECYYEINYVDNSDYDLPVSIGANRVVVEKTLTEGDFKDYVGLYKDNKWEFQKETRFRIFMIPKNPDDDEKLVDVFFNTVRDRIYNPFPYIDFPLKEESLKGLEVMVGPNATESHFLILEALRDRFLPSLSIEASELNSENWQYIPKR